MSCPRLSQTSRGSPSQFHSLPLPTTVHLPCSLTWNVPAFGLFLLLKHSSFILHLEKALFLSQHQCFSTRGDFAPRRHLAISEGISGCQKLVVCAFLVKARDAAQHPTMHRRPHHKKYLPKCQRAEAEEPCPKPIRLHCLLCEAPADPPGVSVPPSAGRRSRVSGDVTERPYRLGSS